MPNNGTTKVLVVDDSAYVRKVVTQMLSRSPSIEVVGIARDGREALDQVAELQPDVITCDLIMPNLDGVGFVTEQMARKPVPIVIVSVASEAGELARELLVQSLAAWRVAGSVARADDGALVIAGNRKDIRIERAPPHAVFRWTVTVDGRNRHAISVVAVLRQVREALDPGYTAVRVRIAVAPLVPS